MSALKRTSFFYVTIFCLIVGVIGVVLSLKPPQTVTVTEVVRLYSKKPRDRRPRKYYAEVNTELGVAEIHRDPYNPPEVGDKIEVAKYFGKLSEYAGENFLKSAWAFFGTAVLMFLLSLAEVKGYLKWK